MIYLYKCKTILPEKAGVGAKHEFRFYIKKIKQELHSFHRCKTISPKRSGKFWLLQQYSMHAWVYVGTESGYPNQSR